MLAYLSVENFFSFKDKTTLSLDHPYNSAEKFRTNTIYSYKDKEGLTRSILNGAILFGANASGKSNLLLAFSFLNYFLSTNEKMHSSKDIIHRPIPFKLAQDKTDISFDISFISSVPEDGKHIDVKTYYKISFDPDDFYVKNEELSYEKILKTKLGAKKVIFQRVGDDLHPSRNGLHKIVEKLSQENIDYKSILAMMNSSINKKYYEDEVKSTAYKIVQAVYNEITKGFSMNGDYSNLNDFIEKVNEDPNFKEQILGELYDFDFAISDFNIEDITEELVQAVTALRRDTDKKSEESVEKFLEKIKNQSNYKITAIHKVQSQRYELPLDLESDGTKKFLSQSINLFNSLINNSLYLSDEFDSKYHIKIQEGILKKFLKQEDAGRAQFLVASHNPLLLSSEFFAKEQICLIEKDRSSQSSFITYLNDFKDISYNNHNWTNLYLEGRFGGLPEVFS
ncbi:putative AbiEii toxin of type IV toxin-antitoxin system [Trichococcus patagoniensis]|uniref:Putative AbiEii toxin of type IV toxin-antitoxin system n=1 Tax=Trichococcus patagoniensis TaxID=382641 RepID=A0A2T5IQ31_9LACT|nr:ATP-binding protein [Trichococcus patagoniensis]PTQ85928.1 putative AbiEii toxin of type IV toxin-antitoxin system [Trichococcus patagoniensis]